jgi:hypothetical protein
VTRFAVALGLALAAIALAGCGDAGSPPWHGAIPPVPIGRGPRFQPPASAGPAASCAPRRARHEAHIELFAAGRVVLVPAGLGVAGSRRGLDGRRSAGACRQAIYTTEPTGVLDATVARPTTGDLFRIWGQPLTRGRMLSFRGPVRAYVSGRRWTGEPAAIPLTRHAQVVLQVGPYIRPHRTYGFAPSS